MDLTHLLNTAIGLLLSGGLWMLKNIMARLGKQDETLASQSQQLSTISTVLMGPTGTNGIRSDVASQAKAITAINTRLDKAGVD